MNLYKILGVRPDATDEDIKRAFRKIARENHPDIFPNDAERIARFKSSASAYQVLSDSARRAQYDRESRPALSIQDLLEKNAGVKLLSTVLPHAPAEHRDGEDLIACLPMEDGHVLVQDPRDPQTTVQVPVPRIHRLVCVAEFGASGAGGGEPGNLYIISEEEK